MTSPALSLVQPELVTASDWPNQPASSLPLPVLSEIADPMSFLSRRTKNITALYMCFHIIIPTNVLETDMLNFIILLIINLLLFVLMSKVVSMISDIDEALTLADGGADLDREQRDGAIEAESCELASSVVRMKGLWGNEMKWRL